MHSSYLSICYETLRIRSLKNLWQDNSDNFWMLQIFWHLSLQLLSWICNRNYIFSLLYSFLLHFPWWVFPAPETPVSFIITHSDVLLSALFFIFSVFSDPLGSLWGSQGGGFSKEFLFLTVCCLSKSSEMSHKKLISLSSTCIGTENIVLFSVTTNALRFA